MKTVRWNKGLAFLMILTPALLASGQTRYSLNTVGYVDAHLFAGSNLVANPLRAGNNSISNLLAGLPAGSFYLPWNQAQANFGPPNRLTAGTGWTDPGAMLVRRDAGFLWVPEDRTLSFVGEPWPGTCISYPPGYTVSGVLPKYACAFCANWSDCQITPDLQIMQWDRPTQKFIETQYVPELGWFPTEPNLTPDESVVLFIVGSTAVTAKSFGPFIIGEVPLFRPRLEGTNFYFEFPSPNSVVYSVQRSERLGDGPWETVLTATTTTSDAFIPVRLPRTSNAAFYRLHALRLVNPSRSGSQFQFQFYAEAGTQYRVSRSPSLEQPSWQPVTSVDGSGAVATVTDSTALGSVNYYRLEY